MKALPVPLPPSLEGLGRSTLVGRIPSPDGRTRPRDVASLLFTLLATVPEMVRLLPDYANSYVGRRRIDPHLRERVQLRIARLNACVTCSTIHTALAVAEGMPACDVRAMEPDAFDAQSYPDDVQAALRLATHLATHGRLADASVLSDLRAHFPDWAVRQIFAAARVICWTNRFNRTWEGVLAWAERTDQRP